MKRKCSLLIVDRNPYIRSFLNRELSAAGYDIGLAANARQTMELLANHTTLDLLILDPDLPDTDGALLLQRICSDIPNLPVVVHTLASEFKKYANLSEIAACIEKRGSSIERLKEVVSDILAGQCLKEQPECKQT